MSDHFGQGINFDGFLKSFLNRFDIPSGAQIRDINNRLDKIEGLFFKQEAENKNHRKKTKAKTKSAAAEVIDFIGKYPEGVSFKEIKANTRFNDKKLRNIIYRLDKIEKIEKVKRGIYKLI
jgi:tetrahydromethanopterin S-methyltransferase subunit G